MKVLVSTHRTSHIPLLTLLFSIVYIEGTLINRMTIVTATAYWQNESVIALEVKEIFRDSHKVDIIRTRIQRI